MFRVRCSRCGAEHDLSGIEPAFARPDDFFAVPDSEREQRVSGSDDACLITSSDGQRLSCFIRTVLEVPIRGEETSIGWGLWVEVTPEAYRRVGALWEDPTQDKEPPFPCALANDLPNYPNTRELRGTMQLTGLHTRPTLILARDSSHQFAVESHAGVPFERALEWRSWFVPH